LSQSSNRRLGHEWATKSCLHRQGRAGRDPKCRHFKRRERRDSGAQRRTSRNLPSCRHFVRLRCFGSAWRSQSSSRRLAGKWATRWCQSRQQSVVPPRSDVREVEPACPMTHTGAGRLLRMQSQTERASWALTPAQHAVLELVARGLTTKAIAARLRMSPATVETHIRGAMERLGARTRLQAAAVAGLGADLRTHADDATLLLESDELRLLRLIATGATVRDAAVSLHVSRRTCGRRLAAAKAKLRTRTTAQAVLLACPPRRSIRPRSSGRPARPRPRFPVLTAAPSAPLKSAAK
jgi:DNA-binding NarL/FixJ family response regulator